MKKNTTILYAVLTVLVLIAIKGVFTLRSEAHKAIDAMNDAPIEYRIGDDTVLPEFIGGYKNVYWRVSNEELEWWQKPFNKWNKAYFVSSGYVWLRDGVPDGEKDSTKYVLFNTKQFKALKDKCRTLGDMKEHIRKSDKEYERWNYQLRKERERKEREMKDKNRWEEALNG